MRSVLLVAPFMLGAGLALAQVPINTNGGFEATAPGVVTDLQGGIEGWLLDVAGSVSAPPTFEIVEDPVAQGTRALAVTVDGLGPNAFDIQAIAAPLPVVPGTTYQYAVSARVASGDATVSFTVGNQAFREYGRLNEETVTEQWQTFRFEFTVDDDETEIRAPIHFSAAGNEGAVIYVDGLRIFNEEGGRNAIVLDAEMGTLGDGVTAGDDAGIGYVTAAADGAGSAPGAGRTVSVSAPFEAPGWYDLYARIYVDADGPAGDSFFHGTTFGPRDPDAEADWVTVERLLIAGFDDSEDYVDGAGQALGDVWKWVNLSENSYGGAAADSFFVAGDNLTPSFEIGVREAGLRIDKLAFGRSDLFFRGTALETGGEGDDVKTGLDNPPTQPLATPFDTFLGMIYSQAQLQDAARYWNQVTPENAGKWGSVEGTRDVMDWRELDIAYALAKDNGNPFRFHVLVWGRQQPLWMASLPPEEQLDELEEWFRAVADRYPDIDFLEVVNEPLNDPPTNQPDDPGSGNYFNALGGAGDTGWDWVLTAFQMARDIFPPDTKLMINDFNILSSTSNANRYLGIVRLLQQRGLIDAIGVQGHAFSTFQGSPITQVLDLLADTDLPLQVTEFDVDGNPNGTAAQSDAAQLATMQRVFPLIWEHPAVEGVTLWGWRVGHWRTDLDAFLIRPSGEERPALMWMREYLQTIAPANEPGQPVEVVRLASYPNPFQRQAEIAYELATPTDASVVVYDLLGRAVWTLAAGPHAAGAHTVSLSADGLASGVYVVRLQAGSEAQTLRVTVLRE
ncbi:MAG: endo-1,4-beta-xylanase [Bacteroidota bacterium]